MADWFDGRLASEITAADIEDLIATRAREDQWLEFKREYHPRRHHEALKDIAALANADGGYLLIGVEESNGTAVGLRAVEGAARLADGLRDSCLQSMAPRLEGLGIACVALPGGGEILVVRVPSSAQKPHMYTLDGRTQFVRRYGNVNRPMPIDEIRSAFLGDALLHALIRLQADFRGAREAPPRVVLGEVTARDNPLATRDPEELSRLMQLRRQELAKGQPFYRVYALPQVLRKAALDVHASPVQSIFHRPPGTRPEGWTIWAMPDPSLSAEGLEGTVGPEQRVLALRNGYVELTHPARSEMFQWKQSLAEAQQHPYLYPYAICEFTVSFIRFCAGLYEAGHLELPVAFGLELTDIKGFMLLPGLPGGRDWMLALFTGRGTAYARDRAEGYVEVGRFPSDPDPVAYDLLSQVYQQFGNRPGSVPFFDDQRHFVLPRE